MSHAVVSAIESATPDGLSTVKRMSLNCLRARRSSSFIPRASLRSQYSCSASSRGRSSSRVRLFRSSQVSRLNRRYRVARETPNAAATSSGAWPASTAACAAAICRSSSLRGRPGCLPLASATVRTERSNVYPNGGSSGAGGPPRLPVSAAPLGQDVCVDPRPRRGVGGGFGAQSTERGDDGEFVGELAAERGCRGVLGGQREAFAPGAMPRVPRGLGHRLFVSSGTGRPTLWPHAPFATEGRHPDEVSCKE